MLKTQQQHLLTTQQTMSAVYVLPIQHSDNTAEASAELHSKPCMLFPCCQQNTVIHTTVQFYGKDCSQKIILPFTVDLTLIVNLII